MSLPQPQIPQTGIQTGTPDGTGSAASPMAQMNRLPLYLYGGLYLLMFLVWVYTLITGSIEMEPMKFVQEAYPNRVTRGLEGAPEFNARMWDRVTFTSPDGQQVTVEKGQILTNDLTARMAGAIVRDHDLEEERGKPLEPRSRLFPQASVRMYTDSAVANLPWERLFTLYNLLGLFSGLFLLLRKPLGSALEDGIATVRQQLGKAAEARRTHREIQERFAALQAEISQERIRLAAMGKEEQALERQRILDAAAHDARGLLESIRNSVEAEKHRVVGEVRARAILAALEKARAHLEETRPQTDARVVARAVPEIACVEVAHD